MKWFVLPSVIVAPFFIKGPAVLAPAAPISRAQDRVAPNPRANVVETDNRWVRTIRMKLAPQEMSGPTELHTTMTMADGRTVDNPRKPGDVAWRDALKHETEHMGPKTAVEIQIEPK
jgi:hypothetical protein